MTLLICMGPTALRGIQGTRDSDSMSKARFLLLTIWVAQPEIESQTIGLPVQRVNCQQQIKSSSSQASFSPSISVTQHTYDLQATLIHQMKALSLDPNLVEWLQNGIAGERRIIGSVQGVPSRAPPIRLCH